MADNRLSTPPRRTRPLHRRLPFPVTLEVNNLLPLESTPLKWARHEHTIRLTHYIRLEIIVNQNQVLYDSRSSFRTTHPSWQHLNEYLSVQELSTEDYETMIARISIDSDSSTSTEERATLVQLPVHPSKLSRIPTLPSQLPLNAIIITFSDDSIRVTPSLYSLLVERKLLETEHTETINEFGRFRDDAFVALDQVTPTRNSRLLLEHADESSLERGLDTLSLTGDDEHGYENGGHSFDMNGLGKVPMTPPMPSSLDDEPEVDDDGLELIREQQLLERLIEQESIALEQDLAYVAQRKDAILACQQAIVTAREQGEQVVEDTVKLCHDSERTAFLLDVQRIRLFRELRVIYPITMITSEQQHRICDLEIPNDLLGGSVPGDECFAALGYLSHLLIMMGKYLSLQYRYRIYYQASRSAIQDDRGIVFPLFVGRNIERDQFDQGIRLLCWNVDCLIKVRNIRVSPKLHILGKVNRVYENVIDGTL